MLPRAANEAINAPSPHGASGKERRPSAQESLMLMLSLRYLTSAMQQQASVSACVFRARRGHRSPQGRQRSSSRVATSSNLADTWMVTVTVTTTLRSLTSLALTPALVSLAAGATQQFAVAATWSDGSTTVPAVAWSSNADSVAPISSPPASAEFVNAPAAGWTTVASLTWSQPVPYRRDPIYDADN
ncbi:MAG: Ig-like domain-containing protein, partial [Gemmatimonadales bacterium]